MNCPECDESFFLSFAWHSTDDQRILIRCDECKTEWEEVIGDE